MGEETEKLELELASFRQQWHEELLERGESKDGGDKALEQNAEDAGYNGSGPQQVIEDKAVALFLKGVELEREKKLYEAISYYRQAVHLYPDVESKIADENVKLDPRANNEDEDSSNVEDLGSDTESVHCQEIDQLTENFQKLQASDSNQLCIPATPSKETHVSALPSELLVTIFRWLVSADLDIRSLLEASLVCKWFYSCSRDVEIWRRICLRVWGINCGLPVGYDSSWKEMYIQRPRLNYGGVFISKYSYVRSGEHSLDGFYRPFHIVEYYRYLRFCADGSVLVYSSPEDPVITVPLLKRKNPSHSGISKAHYRVLDDVVKIVMKKIPTTTSEMKSRRSRGSNTSANEQTFYMELKIHQGKKNRRNRLEWLSYWYEAWNKTTGIRISNSFDLQNFTPFYFSRVKGLQSYSFTQL